MLPISLRIAYKSTTPQQHTTPHRQTSHYNHTLDFTPTHHQLPTSSLHTSNNHLSTHDHHPESSESTTSTSAHDTHVVSETLPTNLTPDSVNMVWHLLFQLQHTPFLPHIPREARVVQVLPATCHAVTTPREPSMLTMVGLLASRRPLPQVCRERRGGLGDPRQGLRHLWHSVLLSAGTTQRRHDNTGFICSTTGIERGRRKKGLGAMILALSVQLGIWKGGGTEKA